MSNFTNIPVGQEIEDMDISPVFQPYSGVEIITGENTSVFAGDRSGRVLTITNEWGTQAQAQNILNSLKATGFQYQPYVATGTILNPAAEVGDGITANGIYSGIYKLSKRYSPLMIADVEAPQDEEVDHEYPYEPKQDREYKREIAEARASISINENTITAEVLRATSAEGTLSSRITQNATSINAKVSQTGGNNSSFGWSLLSNKFSLYSGNKEVFKCNSSGIEVNGKITATSGYIGNGSSGFTITASSIYNGMGNINSTANGIYIGTNGIAIGGGAFKVTSAGAVSAKNMTLTGTLTIGGQTITAAALRSGAQQAYNNAGSWNGTTSTVNSNGSYWSGGAGYGYNYNNATKPINGIYPDYFRATVLVGDYLSTLHTFVCPSLQVDGTQATWKSQYVITGVSGYTSNMYAYLSPTTTTRTLMTYVYNVAVSGKTIYYLGRS